MTCKVTGPILKVTRVIFELTNKVTGVTIKVYQVIFEAYREHLRQLGDI